ncbi:MAG: pantetheine-phosphate adenylyltransferase [Spirochaetales bacterium]|nr:pantetheine-phosphate adenylyltransferase [Spirochaetales bacterium]
MKRVIFPGSFDPPTLGHLNMIERASRIFDEVNIVLSVNVTKKPLFSPEERFKMLEELVVNMPNVKIHLWDKLIVDFAKKMDIKIMLRGVRALADFSYEFELAMTNKTLYPELDVIFLPTDPQYFVLRSSAIKEIAMHGGDISGMVPPNVAKAMKTRF